MDAEKKKLLSPVLAVVAGLLLFETLTGLALTLSRSLSEWLQWVLPVRRREGPSLPPARRRPRFPGPTGEVAISARLRYRKFNQFITDFVFGKGEKIFPITDISTDVVKVTMTGGSASRAVAR